MSILELGPGPGTFTIEAAKHTSTEGYVAAIDIQPSMVLRLRNRLRKESIINVEPIVGSALNLPLKDRVFDRIFMLAVFGELPDKEKALNEANRVLKDRGLLAVREFSPDPNRPRRKTVINWCSKTGFKLVKEYGGFLHYLLMFEKAENNCKGIVSPR